MSTTLAATSAVPRESLGQARALQTRLMRDDAVATKAIERIGALIQARTAKGSIPRPELLTEASRRWREQLSGPGRLSLDIKQSKGRLCIRELRLGAADFTLPAWASDEPEAGFCVLITEMSLQRRTCSFTSAVLVSLSLHSIGRWFQRNFDITTAALTADVALVAAAIGKIDLVDEAKFSIQTGGGKWVGSVQRVLDEGLFQQILAVRTFLTD